MYAENSPKINDTVFDINVPVLGICYGMQAMADRVWWQKLKPVEGHQSLALHYH